MDRCEEVEVLADETCFKPAKFDTEKYYGEIVGVSRGDDEQAEEILFWASSDKAQYLHQAVTLVSKNCGRAS